MITYDTWEAVANAANGLDVKEVDPSLHCDYSCLRAGRCRSGDCQTFQILPKPEESK